MPTRRTESSQPRHEQVRLHFAAAILLACLSWALPAPASAQRPDYDSLYAIAFSGPTDTTTAAALRTLTYAHWATDRDSMEYHCRTLLEELDRYTVNNADPLALLSVHVSIGALYKQMNKPAESIQHLFAAMGLAERVLDQKYIAYINQEIGLNYYLQGNWQKSISYFRAADAYYQSVGDTLRHRVEAYLIGIALSNNGQYAEATPILRTLYREWLRDQHRQRVLETGSGYADALRGSGHLDSAKALYERLMIEVEMDSSYRAPIMGRLQSGLAHVLYEQGRYEEATHMALSSLTFTRRFDYFFPQLEAMQVLYKGYRDAKQWREAFTSLEEFMLLRDSLQSEETNVQLGVAQAVFEHEQREAALLAQEEGKRQVLIVGLALSGILVIVVGFFYRSLSKQKKTSEKLLANILPRETISELQNTGVVTPRVHPSVTIMFCDVERFTQIAESLPPHELVNMLDTYIRRFDEIVSQYGLEKIKTIGDAYMVAGGLHGDPSTAALNTVRAAMDMMRAAAELEETSRKRYGYAFAYRIGIHTGSVISGMVGRDKYAYDIWGDAVNVASRMEHHSEVGRINLSGETNKLVAALVTTQHRGKVTAKNKGEVDMYFVEEII